MPVGPIFVPNLMKPLRASRLRSSLRPSCRQTRTLDRDIRLAFLSSLKIRSGITSPQSAACRAVFLLGACGESSRHAGSRGKYAGRKRLLKSLTRGSETQTMPVDARRGASQSDELQAAHTGGLFFFDPLRFL